MGWTGTYTDKPARELITEEIEYGDKFKVVKAVGKFYAYENVETGEVSALVAYVNADRTGYKTWKLVDEDMGPYDYAPDSILDLLTPTDNKWAVEWRAKSRAANAAKKAMPKVKPGDTIKIDPPVTFIGGWEADTFTFEKQYTFRAANGVRVRLPKNWKTRYTWKKEEA